MSRAPGGIIPEIVTSPDELVAVNGCSVDPEAVVYSPDVTLRVRTLYPRPDISDASAVEVVSLLEDIPASLCQ